MRRRAFRLVAAGLAIALVSGGGTYALVKPAPRPVLTDRTATKITLPDGAGVLYEHPSDPVRLTAYIMEYDPFHDDKDLRPRSYARWDSTFTKVAEGDQVATISPDGDRLVVIDELPFRRNISSVVRITDRITGETFSVPVALAVRQGLSNPHWSPDGGRLLFTTRDHGLGADSPFTAGFVIVDVATRRTSIVRMFAPDGDDADAGDGFYQWGPDGASVATISRLALKLLDLSGRPIRVVPRVGEAAAFGELSPSRRLFITECDAGDMMKRPCVWHLSTGKRLAVVPVTREESRYDAVVGWYDDDHLIVGRSEGRNYTVFVQDLSGRQVKVLARMISLKPSESEVRVFYSRR